jgi:hypothetical protein
MLYYPDNQDFENCSGFSDYEKLEFKGTRFYFKQGSKDKLIVYYHGNAGSACDRSYFKSSFEESGASLIFVEYAGYSNDDVKPSQKLILKDVEHIYSYIQEKNYKNLTVYGQSIGSGAASYHASLGGVDDLILVTPFSRLTKLAQSKYLIYPAPLILTEKYNNQTWLKNYQGRLLILHGDQDSIIPHQFSKELYDSIPTNQKEYLLIQNKGHNDIWSSTEFRDKLREYLKKN